MLNWKCAHTQLVMCTCSSGYVHKLNSISTHAHLKYTCSLWLDACSTVCIHQSQEPFLECSVTFLTLKGPCHKVKIFTFQSVHMHNWKCAYALLRCTHALLKLYTCSTKLITTLQHTQVHLQFTSLSSLAEYKRVENIKKWKHFLFSFFFVSSNVKR